MVALIEKPEYVGGTILEVGLGACKDGQYAWRSGP
jgi:hypothetical protein